MLCICQSHKNPTYWTALQRSKFIKRTHMTIAIAFISMDGYGRLTMTAVIMKLWGRAKLDQKPYHGQLKLSFVLSRAFKCSVKTYPTGLSSRCYFIAILFMGALLWSHGNILAKMHRWQSQWHLSWIQRRKDYLRSGYPCNWRTLCSRIPSSVRRVIHKLMQVVWVFGPQKLLRYFLPCLGWRMACRGNYVSQLVMEETSIWLCQTCVHNVVFFHKLDAQFWIHDTHLPPNRKLYFSLPRIQENLQLQISPFCSTRFEINYCFSFVF